MPEPEFSGRSPPPLTYKGQPIKFFLIDRVAAGYDEKTVCSMFRNFFEVDDKDEAIMQIISSEEDKQRIWARRREIVNEIERTDLTGILMRHINKLDSMSDSTGDIRDLTQIASTLNSLISTVKPKTDKIIVQKTITTNNYNQFNAVFLEDLQAQGIIKILNQKRYEELFKEPITSANDITAFIDAPSSTQG